MNIKRLVQENKKLLTLYVKINNRFLGRNRFSVNGNKLNVKTARLRNTSVTVIGRNNVIEIDDDSYFVNCDIAIMGDNNRLTIGKAVVARGVSIHFEDNGNMIFISEKTTIEHNTELAAIEGTSITIGQDCMFSSDIRICTGDSHSLVDLNGRRTNPSESIIIGKHVWIGTRAMINKGTVIADHCTIGSLSVLTGHKYEDQFSVIAGIPASVIKSGIDWSRERL